MAEPETGNPLSALYQSTIAPYIFGGETDIPYETLKRRQAIATALASQKRGFPKNVGEGLTSIGEAVGSRLREDRLLAQEKAMQQNIQRDSTLPGFGQRADVADPNQIRAGIASAITPGAGAGVPFGGANVGGENPLANPTLAGPVAPPDGSPSEASASVDPVQLAALSTGTISDAPPPGFGARPVEPPNPPTPTDIAPATRVAQAGGIPGPLTKPTPIPSSTAGYPETPEQFRTAPPKPILPQRQQQLTPEEIRGWELIRKYPGHPVALANGNRLIEYGAQKRSDEYARNVEQYKADMSTWEKNMLAWQERQFNRPKLEQELREQADKSARVKMIQERFGSLGVEHFAKKLDESAKTVEYIPSASQAIANARSLLNADASMFTGSDAEIRQSLTKWFNATGFKYNERATTTDMFQSYMAPLLAQMRTAIVGSGPQSEKELAALQQAVGSSTRLERGAIVGILNAVERINLRAAMTHQKKLLTFAGNDPNDRRVVFNTYGIPNMASLVPQDKVDRLRASDSPEARKLFDDAFHTPGLADEVLASGR